MFQHQFSHNFHREYQMTNQIPLEREIIIIFRVEWYCQWFFYLRKLILTPVARSIISNINLFLMWTAHLKIQNKHQANGKPLQTKFIFEKKKNRKKNEFDFLLSFRNLISFSCGKLFCVNIVLVLVWHEADMIHVLLIFYFSSKAFYT